MEYYFAPMEGLTDSVYRRLHHKYFSGVDKYYMPFFSPTVHRSLTEREARELPLADSESFTAVPQLLTKNAEDFLWAARQCADRGYGEVNLNLGCPSGTVFSKGKGSGMLRDPDGLERFLDAIFISSPLPISLKTRLGVEDSEEFERLLEIYNRYPVSLLIVHPRVRKAFYTGDVDMASFEMALVKSKNPVCYNGNLSSLEDIRSFS
ncbi:MAG: tRNA-dihydrouridine synthase family protein, partial [Eubacteriales bacterium]|nr:tRNA-dihydrouridine synthase family protein [Eubacteriales bacterium]